MHIWDWQIFWNEFALEVLAASAILSGLVMLAVWAWTLERKVVFWAVLFVGTFAAIQVAVSLMQPKIEVDRPYFSKARSTISPVSVKEGGVEKILSQSLSIAVRNNDKPAKSVVSQLLLLDNRLDPTIAPLSTRRIRNSNDVGPRQYLNRNTPVNVGKSTRSAFVVYEIRYADVFTDEAYSQVWFMKFGGSSKEGRYSPSLSDAAHDERTKIEAYIKERRIPMLSLPDGGS